MADALHPSLQPLIRQFGIQASYIAANGETVDATQDAVMAVLASLGADVSGNVEDVVAREQQRLWELPLDPVLVAWDGRLEDFSLRLPASATRRAIRYAVQLENGEEILRGTIPPSQRRIRAERLFGRTRRTELAAGLPNTLPDGYHRLTISAGSHNASALIISAPRRCYSGDRPREWGVFAPLYGLRADRNQNIGTFRDLEALMHWTGEKHGDLVATLPISAAFLDEPFEPSPYSPASRLFWNEIFLAGPDGGQGDDDRYVDYAEAARRTYAYFQPRAKEFFASGGRNSSRFREFLALYPDAQDYAQFRAARTHHEESARCDAVEYHLYVQMACHEQLRDLAASSRNVGVRLYLDMPLGVHPESYDVQRHPDIFLTGASAGAPPDPFFTRGQNWGFPPINPVKLREQEYSYWRKVLQTQLRYAGILRLDHVMSLHRLYCVPNGFEATEGVYVRYRADELYAVLTLESVRHEAVIVGEDLGTVPAEVRESMREHGVKRMFVVQFEASDDPKQAISAVPAEAVASLNTHDMPTFRAYWEAHDADLRQELGLLDDEGVAHARETRGRISAAISRYLGESDTLPAASALPVLLKYLAASEADMMLVNLEDLWLEAEPQNVPGTSHERPNWRRRLQFTLEEIRADSNVRALLESIERARQGRDKSS